MEMPPKTALEPTAVGAGISVVAVHVASRRWLSFFRQASLRQKQKKQQMEIEYEIEH